MAKTIEVTYEFEIGDVVVHRVALDLAERGAAMYLAAHGTSGYKPKPGIAVPCFHILERIAQECPGGVQRFYLCRAFMADKYGDGVGHLAEQCRFHEHELMLQPPLPAALPNGDGGPK